MHISLGKRNFDPILFKGPADHEIELAPEHPGGRDELACPDPQNEVQRALTEFLKQHIGFGLPEDSRMGLCDFQQQSPDRFGIGAVGYADGNGEPDVPIRVAPIRNPAGNKVGVGYNDGDIVVGHDRRRAW